MSVKRGTRVSAATMQRIRDYAVDEPSFTIAFAAWELGLTASAVHPCVVELAAAGVVEEIEPRKGPYAAVYAYVPPPTLHVTRSSRHPLPELDASIGVGAQAARHGDVVPHTRSEGPSGKPGADKKRSARGVRVKRARQGT